MKGSENVDRNNNKKYNKEKNIKEGKVIREKEKNEVQ